MASVQMKHKGATEKLLLINLVSQSIHFKYFRLLQSDLGAGFNVTRECSASSHEGFRTVRSKIQLKGTSFCKVHLCRIPTYLGSSRTKTRQKCVKFPSFIDRKGHCIFTVNSTHLTASSSWAENNIFLKRGFKLFNALKFTLKLNINQRITCCIFKT